MPHVAVAHCQRKRAKPPALAWNSIQPTLSALQELKLRVLLLFIPTERECRLTEWLHKEKKKRKKKMLFKVLEAKLRKEIFSHA